MQKMHLIGKHFFLLSNPEGNLASPSAFKYSCSSVSCRIGANEWWFLRTGDRGDEGVTSSFFLPDTTTTTRPQITPAITPPIRETTFFFEFGQFSLFSGAVFPLVSPKKRDERKPSSSSSSPPYFLHSGRREIKVCSHIPPLHLPFFRCSPLQTGKKGCSSYSYSYSAPLN